jgi:CheY-like chemotaxis protein
MSSNLVSIILADDDDGHATLVERNLRRGGFLNTFRRVRDGQELLELLRNQGEFANQCPSGPLLLLLDIKMPRLGGIEVLQQLKADPQLSKIPVIILTTTDDPREIERCYASGCNVYITKPVVYETFIDAVHRIGMFLQLVKFPEVQAS